MGFFIDITDRYNRRHLFNVDNVREIIDYGSYRRLYFMNNSYIYLNHPFEQLVDMIREKTGYIKRM